MKNLRFFILLAALPLMTSPGLLAQTDVLSNMSESLVGSENLFTQDNMFGGGYETFSWGSSFTTGNLTYQLSSVTMAFDDGGSGSAFNLSLYSVTSGVPDTLIETLGDPNPLTAGNYTFTSIGTTLAPNTTYALVGSPLTNEISNYYVDRTISTNATSSASWVIDDGFYNDSTSPGWTTDPAKLVFDIQANLVPEPSTYALLSLGVLTLGIAARRRRA